jgi:D-alanyl-lipoteichoic acid acyltransferase DltB (MBOAT superfamily)
LPLGISFFIFKILSYIIDVYWGKIEPEKHFGIFATYVSFFPSLLSGPIDRAKNFIPQLYQENSLDIERIINGLKLIALGLLKKIVIADRLAIIINKIFNNVESYSGPYFLVAAFLFGFQLYCDFSGYVDIAIGSAKIFGITLSENFNRPFTATSIADFWRRWHITLSSWFQDYVFKPLYMGIARSSWINGMSPRFRHNLSFTLSTMIGLALLGLWHGADWTYVLFGLYHGTMIAAYYLTKKYWDKMHRSVRIFFSFFLVTAGWVFFKANSIYDILYIFENMGSGWSLGVLNDLIIYIGYKPLIYVILYIVFVEWLQKIQEKSQQFLPIPNIIMRWGIYYFILFSILLLGVFNANPGFIYFKF